MSQVECKVEKISEYIDTQYSGGDTNKMKLKQLYQEENNNDIDEITKNFDMGCIVDTVKRPPNICVETCVYNSESENEKSEANDENDDHYSDEFEEDSEVEEIKVVTKSVSDSSCKTQLDNNETNKSVKMSKSHTSFSSKPQSISGRSSDYGSISVPQTRRINMSFTNERLREIERHNHILLNKILGARNNKKCAAKDPAKKPVPSAAVHRKLKQRQIDHDNMILLKKIQRAKSSAYSVRR
ncbi:uncharacterized protein LOC123711901 [Pieris brassicae]|uniref:uncharacterized protein LOC123711901 n=1 Tax=Pieris brassicae TaxID=7116 RepID=UPI001E65F4F4|nr:uncharacterized protein LOC123711901 [Pieris brassicae]